MDYSKQVHCEYNVGNQNFYLLNKPEVIYVNETDAYGDLTTSPYFNYYKFYEIIPYNNLDEVIKINNIVVIECYINNGKFYNLYSKKSKQLPNDIYGKDGFVSLILNK